jgi:hypothetical protein
MGDVAVATGVHAGKLKKLEVGLCFVVWCLALIPGVCCPTLPLNKRDTVLAT